jgi:hypothetical protein
MIKCPNCGKPAGANFVNTEVYVWHDIISVYITYGCECGRSFITRTQINKANEEMYDKEI